MHGDVDESMLTNLIRGFDLIQPKESDEVTIYLASEGGCPYTAFGIYDYIKSQPCVVTMKCLAYVFSAATIILQSADNRLSYLNTRFMIHEPSDEVSGKYSDLKIASRELEHVKNTMRDIYRIKQRIATSDKYMSPQEMLELKLLDAIID